MIPGRSSLRGGGASRAALAAVVAVALAVAGEACGSGEDLGHAERQQEPDGRADGRAGKAGEKGSPSGAGRPNLVVVMTDDQTLPTFNEEVMPFTWRFFRRQGSAFEHALAVPPLCCPARAGFLTGQYAHNHGVLGNSPGY